MTRTSAIVATAPGPVESEKSFVAQEFEIGEPGPHDLVVEVAAVSVNPVDVKVRAGFDAAAGPKLLGYDAAGVVVATGAEVTRFAVGDEVYYAGAINRPGSNAALQLVDERIVGRKPTSLSWADAAALPLTTITAWETLFERFEVSEGSQGHLLVVGGPGGVGSMVIQLARARTDLTVIATASRAESTEWVRTLGAQHVVHPRELTSQVPGLAVNGIQYVFSAYSAGNLETYAEIMCVGGRVVAIDDPAGLDTLPLKDKSQAWMWEFMFAKPLFAPTDDSQHRLLNDTADLVDNGVIRSTATTVLQGITPESLREAHRQVETGQVVGKVVLVR